MNSKNTSFFLLFLTCMVACAGCIRVETDFEPETEKSTVIEGKIITSNGEPVAGVKVKMDYHENKWLAYSKTRHKAETTTDKEGRYRLFFSVKEDEREKADNLPEINKTYSLKFGLGHLDPEKHILPGHMTSLILSVNPPAAVLSEPINATIEFHQRPSSFSQAQTYTWNLLVPRKRFIPVTLTGFVPQQGDYFEVCSAFPYGRELPAESQTPLFPGTNYGYGHIGNYLFVLHDTQEKTFQVPCAYGDNLLMLIRRKNGVFSTEEYPLSVSGETPDSLSFSF